MGWWPGGEAGLEGWPAWRNGGPGDPKGMDLPSKECSGVNIVTYNIRPNTKLRRIFIFT